MERLPVELLYEVQLLALSPSFPLTSRGIHMVFKQAPASYYAQYILSRTTAQKQMTVNETYSRALRYPLCSKEVVDVLHRLMGLGNATHTFICELPRRLFRSLKPKPPNQAWQENDYPLPFLQYLYGAPALPRPDSNSHEGYALTRAVHARHEPLVRFLLERGASPKYKGGLCVKIAIRQKHLDLVRMLIEREDREQGRRGKGGHKKRKLEDRLVVDQGMVRLAVKAGARDIVQYLTQVKGVIPNMQTLLDI
ncbi:hypothetical protein AMATHDRAFT_73744 [Amanita thiersii Skay4041]|uniref:Uncharacterized protein n=1 Tax=Amanita thiersii Skay4041 TaxID=703135 RepID=A0A2A9NS22_9AGAR|nr:hypothetical protein AMATHDRAFT_73744 [Amanita thiersii Skay4041]